MLLRMLKFKTILIGSFIMITSLSNTAFSQGKYLGKKNSFSFGLATNFRLMTVNVPSNLDFGNDLLLPKISLGYLRNRKRNIINIQAHYMALQNSYAFGNPKGFSSSTTIDSTQARSDNFKLNFGVKKYRNIAPVGFYFHISVGANFVFNKVERKTTTKNLNLDGSGYFETNEIQNASIMTTIVEFPFGFGYSYPINKRFILDYGAKMSVYFTKSYKSEEPFKLSDKKNLRYANSKNLFQSNLFEFYVNIQLFSK